MTPLFFFFTFFFISFFFIFSLFLWAGVVLILLTSASGVSGIRKGNGLRPGWAGRDGRAAGFKVKIRYLRLGMPG